MERLGYYLNDPDQPRLPGFSTPPPAASPEPQSRQYQRPIHPTPASPTFSNISTVSNSPDSVTFSISRSSTATSDTSLSWHQGPPSLNHQIMATPYNYGYDLPCEFTFLGCEVRFHPEEFEEFYRHSLSHFGHHPPPGYAICIFCDDREGRFESRNDRYLNWRKRMIHIHAHFQELARGSRPDHFLLDYMLAKKLISRKDFDSAMQFTERPHVDGLVPLGFEIPEKTMKREKDLEEHHDLRKEKREMKREYKKNYKKEKAKEAQSVSHRHRVSQRAHVKQ